MEATTLANAATAPHQLHTAAHFRTMTSPRQPSPNPSPRMTVETLAQMPSIPADDTTRSASWLDTPIADKRIDHALPSNIRDSSTNAVDEPVPPESSGVRGMTKNIFDNDLPYNDEPAPQLATAANEEVDTDDFDMKQPTTPSNETTNYTGTSTAGETNVDNGEEETGESLAAYAMLRFPDSFCLITSMNLVIVRDESYRARYLMQKKEAKKRRKAEQALDEYAREPSHHSLLGDDDEGPLGPGDDGDLEGRPARGLLSNFSEQGGLVSYPADSEDEADFQAERARRRRRKNKANSSSANSIAPQDLSVFGGNGDEGDFMPTENVLDENGLTRDPREWAQLPVHTARPEDIGKISREHLIFSYDMNRQRWVLNVTGRGAVVNGTYYHKGCEPIELDHQAEIFVSTVRMIFELPNRQDDDDTADMDDALASRYGLASTSPVRRLSNAFDVPDSDAEEADDEPQPRAPKPVKIKLTNKKKDTAKDATAPGKGKGKGKGKTAEQSDKADIIKLKTKVEPSGSPEVSKKPEKEKGKKPKAPSADAAGETLAEGSEQPKAESMAPPVVPIIDPGSVLADLAPEQMPEKRKGPGRPPKNGLLSKRDESAIKRKQREYERRGEQAPDLQTLLNIVRAEQRAKDLAAKAQARGEPAPDTPIPSIEADGRNDSGAGSSAVHRDSLAGTAGSPPNGGERASPRPIRRPKSPSPIKPESEFTEEEMKKPNMTYIYIIDEILQNMEGSQADLQTIYDKIQKRWPYYKYRVNSVGWQSSVRHNLLQCDRFKEAGKSGKGRFWTINFDHPLDNKKKRPTPPPRPPPQQMNNGTIPHGLPTGQYGQPGFQAAYGQAPTNGQAQFLQGPPGQGQFYNSPYQQNYGPGPQRPPSNGPYMQHGHGHPPQRAQPQQPPTPAPVPFQRVVNAIVAYRTKYLSRFPQNSAVYKEEETQLDRAIAYYSDRFHGKPDDGSVSEEDAAKESFRALKAIFDEHKDLTAAANSAPVPPPNDQTRQPPPPPPPQQGPQQWNGQYQQPVPPAGSGQNHQAMPPPADGQAPQPPISSAPNTQAPHNTPRATDTALRQPMPLPANASTQQSLPAPPNAGRQQTTQPAAHGSNQQTAPQHGVYQHPLPPTASGQDTATTGAPCAQMPNGSTGANAVPHPTMPALPPTPSAPHNTGPHRVTPPPIPQQPVSDMSIHSVSPPADKPVTPQQNAAAPGLAMQNPVASQSSGPAGAQLVTISGGSGSSSSSVPQAASVSNAAVPAPAVANAPQAAPPPPTETAQAMPTNSRTTSSANAAASDDLKSAATPVPAAQPVAAGEPSVAAARTFTTPVDAAAGIKRPAECHDELDSENVETKRQKTS